MSSLAQLPKLIGFFSYSRTDDEGDDGAVLALANRIYRELRSQLGRNDQNFKLWRDKDALAAGEHWKEKLKEAVSESVFFIQMVTPSAVNSNFCRFEFESFIEREKELGRSDLVFPILYISVPDLEITTMADPVISIVKDRQYEDWHPIRYLDVNSPDVRKTVGQFCSTISKKLREPWLSPEERRRIEEQRRLEEQRQIEEAEARRRAEGEERQRIEEQKRLEEQRHIEEAEARRRAEDEEHRRVAEAKRREEEERVRKEAARAEQQGHNKEEQQSKTPVFFSEPRREAATRNIQGPDYQESIRYWLDHIQSETTFRVLGLLLMLNPAFVYVAFQFNRDVPALTFLLRWSIVTFLLGLAMLLRWLRERLNLILLISLCGIGGVISALYTTLAFALLDSTNSQDRLLVTLLFSLSAYIFVHLLSAICLYRMRKSLQQT